MVTVYPVSEQFYLIIYGEVSWLKEMFDVEMLILNNSSTDTIENCVAELILPEGLSLAPMENGEQSAVQTVDHIPESGSHSVHWYVRGDQEGVYNITATLSGTMMPFEEDFYYEYEAESPIKVYAGNAMRMKFYIPDTAYKGVDYVVRIELENVSDKVLYGVTHAITGWEQGKITYYSDGREVPEVYGAGGFVGDHYEGEFYPGDKIVIEVGFDILFESTLIKNLLETVDQAEELYEYYEAVKTAFDMFEAVTNFCDSAGSAIDGIVSAGKITDTEKLKATNALLSAINKLFGKFEKGDSEAIELANNIQSSDFYKTIKSLAVEGECEAFLAAETAKSLLELANKIECALGEEEQEESGKRPFNAFDSMRTMISNLPVKFVVDSVQVSTMPGSTTTIPYTIEMVPGTAPYMGVENWGRYIYSMTIASMGKIESPWYAQIFGAPDDVTGYDEAVAYIQQTEDQMTAYSVHKSSTTTFRAWTERAAAARSAAASTSDSGFLLETDNETAVYEDGVLTFTGNTILEVTALSGEGGILYIEDDEGNVKQIVIDVVEAHTCHSDTWRVEIAPTADYDGYRAKCCDICGDTIAVEVLSVCSEHSFGEWTVEQEATAETMGIWSHECQNCYAKEIEYHEAGVARNETTDTTYSSLKEALEAAEAGQTVKLMLDCTENTVMVTPGITLDLNGFELSVSYAVGFDTANIIDSVGTGRLVTAVKNLVLDEENAMFPVYDGEGYIFTKAGFAIELDKTYTGEGVRINGLACPVQMAAVELLKDGGSDNNIQIVIQLSWDTADGIGSQEFVFTDQVVANVYSSNNGSWNSYSRMFSMVVTGFDGIENLKANISVISGTNTQYVSSNSVRIT